MVTHYLLHYIGNLYLAASFDVGVFILVGGENVGKDVTIPLNVTDIIKRYPRFYFNCVQESIPHPDHSVLVKRCVVDELRGLKSGTKIGLATIVALRGFHSMVLINDYPGRSLNWHVHEKLKLFSWKLFYLTVMFLTVVLALVCELVVNGTLLVTCSPSTAPTIWITTFFRLFKNCFVDMGVMLKLWNETWDSWFPRKSIAIVVLILLVVGAGLLAIFLEQDEPADGNLGNHTVGSPHIPR